MTSPAPQLTRGADPAGLVAGALAKALAPDPVMTVASWAVKAPRVLATESSRAPGAWESFRAPHLDEIMECLSPSHPSRKVTFKKSAQVGGTECGLNLFGFTVDRAPAPMLILLPTTDEVKKYVATKLQPAIDATPAIKRKVREQKSRDEKGSTSTFKKFPGGFCQIAGSNSSSGLQMISVKIVIFEEVSEYPANAGGRGDPIDQAITRTKGYTDVRKLFFVSTPGIKGACRVTHEYEEGDQRRRYVPCPHCGVYQTLRWENFRHSPVKPYRAHFICAADGCGCLIEASSKHDMLQRGVWIKTYPDGGAEPGHCIEPADVDRYRARGSNGREPSFAIWQAYSTWVPWDDTAEEYVVGRGNPQKEKVFCQQARGEPWEAGGDAPDHLKIFARREDYRLRRLPFGALFATAGVDVQKGRIEFAARAWGVGKTSWLIDKEVIEGDTADPATWRKLVPILERKYPDHNGRLWPIEMTAIDTGYNTHAVYAFVRARGGIDGRVMAVKGMPGHLHPTIGTPTRQDVDSDGKKVEGGVLLWPVGTWPIKSEFYAQLRKTIAGPDQDGAFPAGYVHLPTDGVDEAWCRQLTAEYLSTRKHGSHMITEWIKPPGVANEALDMFGVYAHAAAAQIGMERLTPEDWATLARERGMSEQALQRDLFAAELVPEGARRPTASADVQPAAVQPEAASGRGDWLSGGDGWLDERGGGAWL